MHVHTKVESVDEAHDIINVALCVCVCVCVGGGTCIHGIEGTQCTPHEH